MKHEESSLQTACVKWFRLQYPKRMIFAIPNGGQRSAIQGAILKGEGMLAGVADLFVFSYADEPKGLYVEMKIKKGVQSDAQKEFERKAVEAGYNYAIARSFEEFVRIIRDFFQVIPKPIEKQVLEEEKDESLLINILN